MSSLNAFISCWEFSPRIRTTSGAPRSEEQIFGSFSNSKENYRGDNFLFDCEPNGVQFGS